METNNQQQSEHNVDPQDRSSVKGTNTQNDSSRNQLQGNHVNTKESQKDVLTDQEKPLLNDDSIDSAPESGTR